MQTQKEKCEVLSKFYARAAELGFDVAMKLFQFQHVGNEGWVTVQYPSQFAVDGIEFREDPFYKDWKFETFRITVKVNAEENSFELCTYTSEAVKADLDIFGIEALDNMGIFTDGYKSGSYVVDGVLEIGPDEVHYTCMHKKL